MNLLQITVRLRRLLLRLRRSLLILLLVMVIMWLTHQRWLSSLCSWLDVSEKPQQADFIVYLGGDPQSRAVRAAQLYEEGYAQRIIASGHNLLVQDGLKILSQRGIPIEAIIINDQANTTWDEAQQILAILREKDAKSALIVTNASHTRRASATYEKFQSDSRVVLTFVAAESSYQCENWWNTVGGKLAMQYEYPRIAYYLFRYGISAF